MPHRRSRHHAIATAALAVALLSVALDRPVAQSQARVRAWEDVVTIPTYALHPDDRNPRFFEFDRSLVYPYTMQDHFGSAKVDRTYRAMLLENEFLRVLCLPEIGGRIQSVIDKRTGREMFHRNSDIKPGHIALRGAWISGGIEWNRGPAGHTVTSFSPVDVTSVEHDDGSASLVIGNTEMNFRTGWTVRLTLRPGRAALEEDIELFNPTDGFHPYYFWNNTAFPDTPGARFIYPMSLGTDHNGTTFFRWPVDAGRDLTWVKHHAAPTSIFAYRSPFDFFGAYDVDRDVGIVQVANHHELPGKKAWTWGQADGGRISQTALTDDEDSRYIEIQSGPLPTQADFGVLAPGQSVRWREWWYPVMNLGTGFEFATRDVAVERAQREGRAEFRIAATASFPAAAVSIRRDGSTVAHRTVDLTPHEVVIVAVDATPGERLEVRVDAASGRGLAAFESPLPIPAIDPPDETPAPVEPASAGLAYTRGHRADLASDRVAAREWYRKALDLDPAHAPSHRALGVLDAESGSFVEAAGHFARVVALAPDDGLGWFLLGAARLANGEPDAALTAAYQSVTRHGTAALGYGLAGRVLMRQGLHARASAVFDAGLRAGGEDRHRLEEWRLIAAYAMGRTDIARAGAEELLAEGTTRLLPRVILGLIDPQGLERFAREARTLVGEDEFAFLELGLQLADVGLFDAAARVLEAAAIDPIPDADRRPLPHYFAASFMERAGRPEDAARHRALAATRPPDYVFPSQVEAVSILEDAARRSPGDGRVRLYLGNLYGGLGRMADAVECWREAVAVEAGLSVAHRNLGMHAWKVDGNLDAAVMHFERAITARPDDQVLYRDLAHIRREAGDVASAIRVLEEMPRGGSRRGDVTVLLADSYLAARRFDDTLALLAATTFSNREGNTSTWAIFTRAHIERGITHLDGGRADAALRDFSAATTYPVNLNVGRPAVPLEAEARYWEGRALAALGRTAAARAAWEAGAQGAATGGRQAEFVARCAQQLADLPAQAPRR